MMREFPDYTTWGDCFEQDGMYYTLKYLSTYPDREEYLSIPDTFATFTYPEKWCTEKNKNYFEYLQMDLDTMMSGLPSGCYDAGDGLYAIYDASTCDSTHNIVLNVYLTPDCSGDPILVAPLLTQCEEDDNEEEDEDWDYDNALEASMCT